MRVHALLSWYDEQPEWLYEAVASLDGIADRVVALDGAYALFPDAQPASGEGQAEAIEQAAADIGMDLDLRVPGRVWVGGEVEKRTELFRMAEAGAEVFHDWYFVVDADSVVVHHHGVRELLTGHDLDVGTCLLMGPDTGNIARVWAEGQEEMPTIHAHRLVCQVRNIFRALPGLHCDRRHCTYKTPEGRVLWGDGHEEAFEVDCRIDHRTDRRDPARMDRASFYYRERDRLGIEQRVAA